MKTTFCATFCFLFWNVPLHSHLRMCHWFVFSFTAFWSLLHRQHSLDQLPFFIHVGFSLVSIFPDISLLCFWPVYWLFRLYVHDASNEIHVSIRDFIYPDVLSVVACCFCCNFCVARFLFFPDTSILLLFMGDYLLYMIVCLGINQFLLNCTRSTSIGYNRTSRHPS